MVLLKLTINAIVFILGVFVIHEGRLDVKRLWYPVCIGLSEIIIGIIIIIISFTIWFIN